ncbi:MAG: leucine-rich repeat protein, partial [Hominimerdicola sp.]
IGNYAFRGCSALSTVNLPSTVTSIGNSAFNNCSSMSDVYYTATQEEWDNIDISDYNTALTDATIHFVTSDISNCTITIPKNSYEYTGSQIKPKVTITDGENTLVNGTDYVIRYADNIEVGTASIIIAGRGNYSGKVTYTFEITESTTDISNCTITIPKNSYEYTGSPIKPKVTITNGENTLVNGTDYVIRYANNIEVGTASIIIAGRGNYSGKVTYTFEITETTTDISNCTITIPKNSYEYTGSQIKPKVTITDGENTLVNGTDYVIRYADNIEVGTASIIIAGRGNYSGKVTKTFEITEILEDIE